MQKSYVVCYDIPSHLRRRRCLKLLRAQAGGYQDSCFEVFLGRHGLVQVLASVMGELDVDEDKLLLFPVMGETANWQLGTGPVQTTGNLWLVT